MLSLVGLDGLLINGAQDSGIKMQALRQLGEE